MTAGVVAFAAAMAGGAFADQSYPDATGDAQAGTDITGMTVTNDASGGIGIQVGAASPLVGNHAFMIFIDADKNQSTGDLGDEYWLYGGPDVGIGFLAWNGSQWADSNPAGFSVGAAAANVMDFRFTQASIGNTTSFNFAVVSVSIDESGGQFTFKGWDAAPDRGYHTYDVATTQCANAKDDDGDGKIDSQDLGCSATTDDDESDEPVAVTIKVGKAKVTPARPKSGGKAVVSVPVTNVGTGTEIDGGSVVCAAKVVSGKALRGIGKVVAGRAVCTFKVPVGLKGKTVRGTVGVTYKTAKGKAPFSFKVA
jgi:hypothetical protein